MASLQIPAPPAADPAVRERPHTCVSVRRQWSDEWADMPYLQALVCSDAAAPGMPYATFRWAVGDIKWEDEPAFSTRVPIDLRDWFVRVEVLGTATTSRSTLWVGRICDDAMDVHGGDGGAAMGDQDLAAFGLAYELDRATVDGSLVQESDDDEGINAIKIDTPLVFNGSHRRGLGEFGNRSTATPPYEGPDGETRQTYVFLADGSSHVSTWTVRNVLEYLLAGFGPAAIRFTLGGQLDTLDVAAPRLPAVGSTLLELIERLIDRRRGLGWCVRSDGQAAEICVFALDGEPTQLDNGVSLPAATEQTDLVVDDFKREIAEHRLTIDAMARYDTIEVVGERVLVCFSVSYQDENLEPGWSISEQTAYKEAAGGDDDAANDEFRQADRFAPVFAHYHIRKSWRWLAGGGDGGTKHLVNVAVRDPGYFSPGNTTPAPVRRWGHLVERWIPLRREDGAPGADVEYREPAIFVRDETGPKEDHRWLLADTTSDGLPKAQVRVLDRAFGVEVRFSPRHYLAKPVWAGAKKTKIEPRFSYGKMIATIAARTDERLRVTFRVNNDVPPAAGRRLLIEEPDCELWWIAPSTVLDVDAAGELLRETRSGLDLILRNDIPRLRNIGLLAKAWYGKPRASLRVTFREMRRQFRVGVFVRQVSDASRLEPINSTVTRVTWDLQAMTSTIETQYGDVGKVAV